MLERLFPRPVDNRYEGYKAAAILVSYSPSGKAVLFRQGPKSFRGCAALPDGGAAA